MFELGFWELLLIAIIGLLVLGPERLPGALRSLQRMISNVRGYAGKMQAELNHELRIKELHEHLQKAEQLDADKLSPELQRSMAELRQAAAQVQRPYAATDASKTEPVDNTNKTSTDSVSKPTKDNSHE
ncbi:Sec-independent protein translocase TatB [Pseudidiomarina planktonica]|uniref:Sec-independent protein translocase protein TatB n=1 Tax=Pseudidiomarina planktonica TaxID=1323738 RepID=A0A1Y6G0I0_9GAMM|nr:Sec-independent protein translocase protein TatB [Pseudidiomarina planktonica]RUO63896.1 Sec-independent protein translocase protein TatB [Pseudidiomarina planktonica]SMQ80029.1 Sec-independent protein translocase TatB [Pseudidiomarina planktonica]